MNPKHPGIATCFNFELHPQYLETSITWEAQKREGIKFCNQMNFLASLYKYLMSRCFRIIAQTSEFPMIFTTTSVKRTNVMTTEADMTVLFSKAK